ncbi:MAG: carbohydrate ABC transporter permease [Candidatus Atribacteria bacterium]|nr:carbohydrate ABC transporter permease [Candidatus Atribacteria bacterium]
MKGLSLGPKVRKSLKRKVLVVVGIIIALVFIFPIIWMAEMSFKTKAQNIALPPLFVFTPTFENYSQAIDKYNFFSFLKNSLIVVVPTVLLSLLVSLPASYGFSRFNFKKKKDIAFWILSLRMAPAMAVILPYFVIGGFLRILDKPIILIVAYLSFNVPFAIWMMRSFFDEIPLEVEEAGMVEGLSRLGVFLRISLPLARGGLAATAILCTIQSYNEFAFALFLTSFNTRTLPTVVTQFQSHMGILWGPMAATSLLATFPIMIAAILVRKSLVSGMSFGMVKGK